MLRKLLPHAWLLLGLISIPIVLIFLSMFISALRQYWWVIIILGLAAVGFVRRELDPLLDEIQNFRYGKKGEEEVRDILDETLDDNYVYVENYLIPNTRIGDIDGLLIGPKGIIILEVKNYVGVFRISGNDILRRLRGDIYKLYRKSPFKQVMRQAKYLSKFFKEKSVDTRVMPMVVLVTGLISVISGETGVFITEIDKLTNNIFKISPVPNWSTELSNKIIATLGLEKTSEKPIPGQSEKQRPVQ
jgi:hypothetical protein